MRDKDKGSEDGGTIHYCVREQRAAFRAIRVEIDNYFLQGKDCPESLEELGKRVEVLLRYARAASSVVCLRNEVGGMLVEEDETRKDEKVVESAANSTGVPGEWQETTILSIGEESVWRKGQKTSRDGNVELQNAEEEKVVRKSVAERYEAAEHVVSSVDGSMRRKSLRSLEKGMTINDRLYFRQELCGGNAASFKRLIALMDTAGSVDEAVRLLSEYCGDRCDCESEGVKRFVMLLEQRYGG